MRHPRRGSSVLLLLAFVLTLAAAPAAVGAPRGPNHLTGPSDGDAFDIAVRYLREHHGRYGL
jgi:hypothetical protein